MPTRHAHIATDRAERYLHQLCGHLGAMRQSRHRPGGGHGAAGIPRVEQVEQRPGGAVVRFAEGTWSLEATVDALVLRVEAEDGRALERLTDAISARIAKIGRRDGLCVEWSRSDAPGHGEEPGVGGAAAAVGSDPRRRWRRAGWVAVVVLAVGVHLGLIGSLHGPRPWTSAAADVLLALLAVKLVLLALHGRSRHGVVGHRSR